MQGSIVVLGSTGSIGRQTLDVCRADNLRTAALAANNNVELLEAQAREFLPDIAVLADDKAAMDLKIRLADTPIRVLGGDDGIAYAAAYAGADTAVCAMVGIKGLLPVLAAIDSGKRIALANKETLVCAGEFVMKRVREKGVTLLPVDSEHSAIFQCLDTAGGIRNVSKLILTASGGPFYGKTRNELRAVTPEQALKHPNWEMGAKITIDSATMMNKGFEVIEAMHLFGMPLSKITVIIQRESVIHSCVEFVDHAVLAQLGSPDMRIPIQYALTYPERKPCPGTALDFESMGTLSFGKPDEQAFRCLALCKQAAGMGMSACAAINGANEVAVSRFLKKEIGFLDIEEIISKTIDMPLLPADDLDGIFHADSEARRLAMAY